MVRLFRSIDAVVLAGSSLCVLALIVVAVRLHLQESGKSDDQSRLHEYCGMVHFSLVQDAIELESGNPATRAVAGNRFAEQVTGHSPMEIRLCASRPVELSGRDQAWLGLRYDLLAAMARDAADATEVTP